jgi:hypothetical protein
MPTPPSLNPNFGEATALVSLVGFAIQQALQGLDAFISSWIDWFKGRRPDGILPGNLMPGDFKKSVMTIASFVLGLTTVFALPQLLLLQYANILPTDLEQWHTKIANFVVSALVLSAGTEGVNTVLKYFGYIKDARKTPSLAIDVIPKATTVPHGNTFQFLATAKNGGDSAVDWHVLTGNGGTIDSAGLYTAPATTGIYQIAATSKADPNATAIATVTVT